MCNDVSGKKGIRSSFAVENTARRMISVTATSAFILLVFRLPLAATEVHHSAFNVFGNVTVQIDERTLKTSRSSSLVSCAQLCGREPFCKFASFDEIDHCCILVSRSGVDPPDQLWIKKEGSTGIEKIDDSLQKGLRKELPVLNCKELLRINPAFPSGLYWIDPDAGHHDNAFRAFCDQETAGGGWTLVWSYRFTNYQSFDDGSNAITPRPNWQVKRNDVPVSTTPPLTETQYDAVQFSLWKKIGSDVMIKSTINNWITCSTGSGSLVDWVEGSVRCRLVKVVNPVATQSCPGVFPVKLRLDYYGPIFETASTGYYYYFDGYTGDRWPTHNPCGRTFPNHLTGVQDPRGNVFIR